MESGHIAAIAIASIICGTIAISAVVRAWLSGRGRAEKSVSGSVPRRLDALEERLYRLEQAIDSVAVEVERGSEAQRFTAKLLAERLEAAPSGRVSSGGGAL